MKVISGPGEFPTGRSIRFEEGSDIRIMDGQAAISFRSYYAGKTVIEASADGLEKSRIEIEFVGDNVYREGVTPIVSYRPYVRFVREQGMSELQTSAGIIRFLPAAVKRGMHPVWRQMGILILIGKLPTEILHLIGYWILKSFWN